jgi:hypothetical protein
VSTNATERRRGAHALVEAHAHRRIRREEGCIADRDEHAQRRRIDAPLHGGRVSHAFRTGTTGVPK